MIKNMYVVCFWLVQFCSLLLGHCSRGSSDGTERENELSMTLGKHLVRISSASRSKPQFQVRPSPGGYKIIVNPKFSHIIEISQNLDTSVNNEKTASLKNTEDSAFEEKGIDWENVIDEQLTFSNREHPNKPKISQEQGKGNSVRVGIEKSKLEPPWNINEESDVSSEETQDEYSISEFENDSLGHNSKDSYESQNFIGIETSTSKDNEEFTLPDGDEVTHHWDEDFFEVKENLIEHDSDMDSVVKKNLDVESENVEDSDEEESSRERDLVVQEGSGDTEERNQKSGRILSFLTRQNASSPNQTCTTPKGEPGRCVRMRRCLLSNALSNFSLFLQYLCLIRGAIVGVCCPDNPVIEVTNEEKNEISDMKPAEFEIKQPSGGCGVNVKKRIVGGKVSVPHEWSWMVALLRRNTFYCGGVIINNWYILTAAHCVLGIDLKELTVRLGEYNFNVPDENVEDVKVAEIKLHAKFVTITFEHDIALLRLSKSVRYTKFATSVCLPQSRSETYAAKNATVVGWGTVSFGGAVSPVLRQVTVPVWHNKDCDRIYGLDESIGDPFMCAGAPEGGEDACQGDSGGPLMFLNAKERWEVIGIVSWGRRCGDPTYPGVYTRVTTYLDWIEKNVK